MAMLLRTIRFAVSALMVAFVVAVSAPAGAQQPSNVNPTAAAVSEQKLLEQMQRIQGLGTIPDVKSYTIEQPAGRDWRHFHQVVLPSIGAIAILGMLIVLVGFYLWRGMIRIPGGRSGRTVVRFNAFERFIHWMTATCFVVLAITGLNITFGKMLLLPLIGPAAFSGWSEAAKYAHDFLSFPFTIGVVVIFLMWIAGNIPNKVDVEWVKQAGGLFSDNNHPPSYRFNAGQKVIYWIVVGGGTLMAVSGYVLLFPFYGTNVANMQTAEMFHGVVAVLFIAAMIAHIYIGSIGMEGAFEAMATGEVDANWAKEHHNLWYEQEMKSPPSGGAVPHGTPAE
jgi:formate dehydrogenase subunit gamma